MQSKLLHDSLKAHTWTQSNPFSIHDLGEGASAGQPGGAYGHKAGAGIAVGGGGGRGATPPGVGGSSMDSAPGQVAPPSKGPACMGLSTMSLASNGSNNEHGSGSDPESGTPKRT